VTLTLLAATQPRCLMQRCSACCRCCCWCCREFFQCDFDIAGSYAAMVPDAEVLSVLPLLLLLLQGVLPV
jgi:hypothetical protein